MLLYENSLPAAPWHLSGVGRAVSLAPMLISDTPHASPVIKVSYADILSVPHMGHLLQHLIIKAVYFPGNISSCTYIGGRITVYPSRVSLAGWGRGMHPILQVYLQIFPCLKKCPWCLLALYGFQINTFMLAAFSCRHDILFFHAALSKYRCLPV